MPKNPAKGVPAAVVQACLQHPASARHCPAKPTVYLTIDDGPSAYSTPKYLAILKQYKVNATFFAMGSQVEASDPQLLRDIVASGSRVGIHSWSHDYSVLYPHRRANAQAVEADARRALASVRKALGADFRTGAYRYPGGHMSWEKMAPADAALKRLGLSWVDWNAMFGDAEPPSRRPGTAAGMASLATRQARACHNNTVVVLLHDGPTRGLSIEAMPLVIEWFQAHGYQFGTIA